MEAAAAYILYNKKNKVLLQHRTFDAPTEPDYWGLFGGRIEKNETPEKALKREAREELGIDLKKPKLFKTYIKEDEWGKQKRYVFIGLLEYPVEKLKQQQKEGIDVDLFSLDELKKIKITKSNLELLEEIIKTL